MEDAEAGSDCEVGGGDAMQLHTFARCSFCLIRMPAAAMVSSQPSRTSRTSRSMPTCCSTPHAFSCAISARARELCCLPTSSLIASSASRTSRASARGRPVSQRIAIVEA